MERSSRADKQRRPPGDRWVVTDELVAGLEKIVEGGIQQKEITARLSRRLGYDVDPSSVSNILRRVHPTSSLAGPLAMEFDLPMPPLAVEDERLAKIMAAYAEILLREPGKSAEVDEFAEAVLTNLRRLDKAKRGTPDR